MAVREQLLSYAEEVLCSALYAANLVSLYAANWFDSETGLFIWGECVWEGVANCSSLPPIHIYSYGG